MKFLGLLFVLLASTACSDSESKLVEIQTTTIEYVRAVNFSDDMFVDGDTIYTLDGKNITSIGSVFNAINAGTYKGKRWVCGGNSDGFFVSERGVGEWLEPMSFDLPKELDEANFFTTFDCAVTSKGFLFEISEETDDAPILSNYTLDDLGGELQLMEGRAPWAELGWDDSLARVALFQDGIGYQTAGAPPILLNADSANSFAASVEQGVIGYGLTGNNTKVLMMTGSDVVDTIDIGHELVVVDVDRLDNKPILLGVAGDQLQLEFDGSIIALEGFVSSLHVFGGYVYVGLQGTKELKVFELQ